MRLRPRSGAAHSKCQSRWCWLPPRLHTPHLRHPGRSTLGPVRPAGWRAPKLTGAFPADVEPAQPGERVCAGHRPAIQQPAERQNTVVFDTPTRYKKEGLRPRFRRSEALSRTWWQVKDSNLRSFRDGFTDHRHQASDQRQCLSPSKLPGVFPTDSRRQPTSAVANRTPMSRAQEHLSLSPSARPGTGSSGHCVMRGRCHHTGDLPQKRPSL